MGLGRFGGGVGAVRYFARRGAKVVVTDLADATTLAASLDAIADLPDLEIVLGRHRDRDFRDTDLVVASPAVPIDTERLDVARCHGITVTTEIAVFLDVWRGPVLGVSGSNGKSTTVTLLRDILRTAGRRPVLGGNIGRSLLPDVDDMDVTQPVVLEISSFQLEHLDPNQPCLDGAILTNITPNHLDRHHTMERYRELKTRLVRLVHPGGTFVAGDETARVDRDENGPDHVKSVTPVDVDAMDGVDELPHDFDAAHQRRNLGAALALAQSFDRDVPRDAEFVCRIANDFSALPHRHELVATHAGVRFVNDSKATTPDATVAALERYAAGVHLIFGGRDKGLPLDDLWRAVETRVCGLWLIGEVAQDLGAKLLERGLDVPYRIVATLEEAVVGAGKSARAGDVVLLSPAYPSYGLFHDYRQRGNAFRNAVENFITRDATTSDDDVDSADGADLV